MSVTVERDREVRRRRHRRKKLRLLRARLMQAKTARERQRIIEKIRRISPRAPIPEV
ncbi:MAG: hypothetical protein RML36_08275 [Anaerolineae bacterium]|nr:hypothetical protein [Anaerolineae bacterium]MDW8099459.1 hypothetical protein [Anaerolineae bacterium]